MKISIRLNGDAYEIEHGCTVARLVGDLQLHAARIAVEINRRIVPKAQYGAVSFEAGDEVEIINFVGGG